MAKRVRKLPSVVLALEPERRESIRAAINELGDRATVKAVRAKGGGKNETVATILKLVRSGELDPSEPWAVLPGAAPARAPDPPAAPLTSAPAPVAVPDEAVLADFFAKVRDVRANPSNEALGDLALRTLELQALGLIEAKTAAGVQKHLHEARQNLKDKRESGEDEVARSEDVMMAPDAVELVRTYERIVNGRRRRRIRELAVVEAAADAIDFTPEMRTDPDKARAKLDELGLDQFAEPIDVAPPIEDDRTAGM